LPVGSGGQLEEGRSDGLLRQVGNLRISLECPLFETRVEGGLPP
jgi:hypothetical protein